MITILGTGQLGTALLEALLHRNPEEQLLLVNRKGRTEKILAENIRVLAADVTSEKDMLELAQQSAIIFSCTDMSYPHWKDFYPATARALAHALRNSAAKLVFADNLYSYGNVSGKEMTEQMPHTAKTRKGKIRARVIQTLLYSGEEFNKRVAFVKAADFVGPRIHKGIFGTDFLDRVYRGKPVLLFGDIGLPHSFTSIEDFAEALVNVGSSADAYGQVWQAPNAPALSVDKWVHLFEVITGKKIRKKRVSKFEIRLAGLFNPLIREYHEMAYQFEYPYLVNHDKYAGRFGNHARYPSAIVRETVDAYLASKIKKAG